MEANRHDGAPVHEAVIEARLVTDHSERMLCLPEVAGNECLVLEHTIYDMLRLMCPDYDGGLWEFFKLSNGGLYMAPEAMQQYQLFGPGNGFNGVVCANSAGIIATAMAYSHLSFHHPGDCFPRAYVHLTHFIHQQKDAATILAALD